MGFHEFRRSIRASLASVGAAAVAASALVGFQTGAAFASADKITVTPDSGPAITVTEGSTTNGQVMGRFTDTGRPGGGACRVEGYVATINWGDGSSDTGTVSCEMAGSEPVATGVYDVVGAHTYADSMTAAITVSVVDNSEDGESSGDAVKTATATVGDAELFSAGDNSRNGSYTAVEGKSIAIAAYFADDRGFAVGVTRDTSITGTINWGDGTAVQTVPSTDASSCECNFAISASHVYDAPTTAAAVYHISVTATDDGGATVSTALTATISDGTLTAGANKSLSGVATTASTSVVGSFTDAAGAQAAVADFTAAINWGDSTTSAGTLTKTAEGAFSVSGTHTYATAGSKSITATVTDQEGSTVTLHATATIAVAPPVLPATGQPHPNQPATPLVLFALLILGLFCLAVGGRILIKMPR